MPKLQRKRNKKPSQWEQELPTGTLALFIEAAPSRKALEPEKANRFFARGGLELGLSKLYAFVAARFSACTSLAMIGFDTFAVRAVVMIVINIAVLGSILERVRMVRIYLGHESDPFWKPEYSALRQSSTEGRDPLVGCCKPYARK